MEQVFTNKEHGSTMMKSLAQLWKDGKYCDAVLEVGSHKLEFHKLVLVACSPFVLGSRASESDAGKLILKLNGEGEDVVAAKACLQYMYEGIVQVTENNVDNVVGIARSLHLEDLVMYCSSFQELVINMKKFKKSSSDDISEKTHNRFELVIENEKFGKSEPVTKTVSKDTPDSTREDQSAFEMSTEHPDLDSGDDSHSDLEQKVPTSNISDSVTDSALNEASGKMENITVKLEPDFDGSDAESNGEDNEMFDDNADSDDSYTPQIKKKKKSPKFTKTKASPKKSKKSVQETGQFTVVKNEEDNSFNEAGQEEMNTDLQTNKLGNLFSCEICGATYKSKANLRRHKDKHSAVPQKCHCGAEFIYRECLQRHMKAVHLGGFKCKDCAEIFASQSARSVHIRIHHSTTLTALKCQVCDKQFGHTSHLKDHLTVHLDVKQFSCELCGKTFKYKRACKLHMKRSCKDRRFKDNSFATRKKDVQICPECGKCFSKNSYLKQHMQMHELQNRPCPKCGRVLRFDEELEDYHTNRSTNYMFVPRQLQRMEIDLTAAEEVKPKIGSNFQVEHSANEKRKHYKCDDCEFNTKHKFSMMRHIRIKHRQGPRGVQNKRKYRCSVCEMMLSSKASLEAHKRAKHGGTKIICDVCASVFNSDQILQRHIRMAHEGNALFKCQHCEQTFMEKQCYEGHLNKHLNIKPYSCMTCNKTFVYKTSLSRHVVVCSGPTTGDVKEYRCHVCNAVLASKASLANHVSGVHGGKKTCACGREFNWSSSLCRHVKSCTIVTQMVLNKEVISGSDLLSNNSLFGGQL